MLRELGYETITGTPGTSASLTVAAASHHPRLSDVGPVGVPIAYSVVVISTGQTVCKGIGISTGAGAFTRQIEFSQYDDTNYTLDPASLASIPSGCAIFCSVGQHTVFPTYAPVEAGNYFDPAGNSIITSAAFTVGAANRDYWWRDRINVACKISELQFHSAASGVLDFGIYAVDWSTGKPGKLLLGWQGISIVTGFNSLLMTAATLGALPKATQRLPLGDVYYMANWSSTSAAPNRVKDATAALSGSLVADLASPQHLLYTNRTNNTSFGDSPTITGRITSAAAKVPIVVAKAA